MTNNPTRHAILLAEVDKTAKAIQLAADAHHRAMVRAVRGGCTQGQLSAVLGVSRQAVAQYVRRWINPEPVNRPSGPTLF